MSLCLGHSIGKTTTEAGCRGGDSVWYGLLGGGGCFHRSPQHGRPSYPEYNPAQAAPGLVSSLTDYLETDPHLSQH